MNARIFINRLSHPRVRQRLKIALSFYAIAIIIGLTFKLAYDIGYFNALSLKKSKVSDLPIKNSVVTIKSAQSIVSGALKEDPSNPKTLVTQIIDNNYSLATIIIENDKSKRIAWIIDMRLFFIGDLLNTEGYNLTADAERQYNISR